MPSPVATLTLNPAIDIAYCVKQLVPGVKTESTEFLCDPGGNGINVSRGLRLLGIPAHTCCVLAGKSGAMLRALLEDEVDLLDVVEGDGLTRFNCTIDQRRPPEEFKIKGVGPRLSEEAFEEVTRRFRECAGLGYGVLTGSAPPGWDTSVYIELSGQLRDQGARAVIDTEGSVLREITRTRPFLIKPNLGELEDVSGLLLKTVEAIAEQARKLQLDGAEFVAVSLGCDGAVLVTPDNSYYGNAPQVSHRCSTGAGDAFLAGLLAEFIVSGDPEKVLVRGLACGTGTTAQPGSRLFELSALGRFEEVIEVRQLDI